jgi:predicted RecB family endonuclease
MAEDFNPLDPLGPSYGGNADIPTVKNFMPFEGDSLKDPVIKTPPVQPILPSPEPFSNPTYPIKKNYTGSANNQKPQGNNPNTKPKDVFAAWALKSASDAGSLVNKNKYGKVYAYNAGPTGQSFFKRYQAYGQEKFDAIGFTPFRDNDAVFNAGTTTLEDSKRFLTHSFWPLFAPGFTSSYKSLSKALQGDFSPDLDESKRYSEAAAIGYSSKGGFGSFINNTAMSFAYTAGIMSSAILEEVAAGMLAPLTGGSSLFAATANNLRKVPLLTKGLKGIDLAMDTGKAINKTLHGLNDINKTRNLFKSVGNFLNPLDNLTDAAKAIYKNEDNFTGLARVYSSSMKTAGGLYRDVRALNMALSEARLEGGMVENDLYKDLYNDFYRRNGYPPTDKQQERMVDQSKQAGMTALKWNTGIIYASNKIVFPNLINPKGGIKNFLKGATDDVLSFKTGKVVFERAKKSAEDVGKQLMKGEFKYVENSLVNTGKAFLKDPFRKGLPAAFTYFKANITEGLQENAQEVISDATKRYYEDTFYNPAVGTYNYAKGLVESSIGKQFSSQGLETFSSGFLMGMFAAPLNASIKYGSIGMNRIFDKEVYNEYKNAREKVAKQVVETLNAVNPKEFFNSRMFNYGNQFTAAKAKMTQSEKVERDIMDAAFQSQINTVLDTDTMDYFIEHIQSFKQMTPEEFEESFGLEPGTGAERQGEIVDRVVERAQRMQKRHNQYKDRFPNPINLKNYRKDSPEYKDAEIYHEAWETARKNAVFFNESFEDTASRMKSIIDSVTNIGSLKNVSNSDVNVLFDRGRLANEIGLLKNDIETLKQTGATPDSKNLLEEKKRKLASLEKFSEKFNEYYNFFNKKELIDQIKAINPEISSEDLAAEVEKKYGKMSDEKVIKMMDDLKSEFGNYLNSLTKGPKLFDSDIENAFEKFIDFYDLEKESRSLVDYINLLHNPEGYIEHVNRNAKWMKDLYNNRKEYYKDMVDKAMKAKEGNDLLNHLADRNIYISLDAFNDWMENGKFPEEFYDDSNNTVITSSNPKYQEYIQVFILLSQIQKNKTGFAEEEVDTALQDQLNELDKQKSIDLNNLVKTMQRQDNGIIEPTGKMKYFSMGTILEESLPGEYIEATYEGADEPIVYYNDMGNLKYDNAEGELVEMNDDINFTSAVRYSNVMKADPAEVQMINEKYEKLRAEIIDSYREGLGKETQVEKTEPITITTPIDEIQRRAPELYESLMSAYQSYFESLPKNLTESASEEQKENFFADFMRTSLSAKDLISQYNQNAKIKAATEETGEVEDFTFMINGKKVNTADYKTIPNLRKLISDLELIIDNLNKITKPSLENINSIAEMKAIQNKLELLIKSRSRAGYSTEMKKAIEQIEQLKDMQKNILFDGSYVINGKVMERVTKAIQRVLPKEYSYKYMDKVMKAYDTALANYKKNNPNVTEPNEAFLDEFINELRNKKIKDDGLSENAFKKMKSDMLNFMNRGYISREGLTSPIQNGTVTVDAPMDEMEMVKKWIFNLKDGNVIDGRHITIFGDQVVTDDVLDQPSAVYNKLRQNRDKNYVFNTSEIEDKMDKFNILREEVKPITNENTYDEATEAGNYIDRAIKELFAGKTPVFNPAKITEEAYNQLFGENGYLAKIKEMVDTGQYYVVSEDLRVYDEDAAIAGEIDLLLVDQSGKMFIVDVKTGKESKWAGYNDPTSIHYNKKIENTYQQAAYARLLQNMFPGLDVNVGILPIQITYEDETGMITSVSRPVDKKALKPGETRLLAPGKYIVNLDKNSVKEDIDKLIPLKAPITVGTEMSPAAKAKLSKLGFTSEMIDLMSDEDIETAKAATSKDDVKDLITKYELLTQGMQPQSSTTTTTDAKASIESKTKEELFPIDSLHVGKESGDTLKVIGYTKDGVRFEIQTEGTLKPKKNVSISELKRLITEDKLAALEQSTQGIPTGDENVVRSFTFGTPTSTPELISVDDVVEKLKTINDMQTFLAYQLELNNKALAFEITPTDMEVISDLLSEKKAELTDPTNVKISESSIQAGDKLTVISTIFKARNPNEVFADVGAEIRVSSVENGKVKFKYQGSQRTLDLSEINDYFTTMSIEEYKAQYTTGADPVTKETSVDSSVVTENFLETANLNELDQQGKTTSLEDALAQMEKEREENCES